MEDVKLRTQRRDTITNLVTTRTSTIRMYHDPGALSKMTSTLARWFHIADKPARARLGLASPAHLATCEAWHNRPEIRDRYIEG